MYMQTIRGNGTTPNGLTLGRFWTIPDSLLTYLGTDMD